MASSSGTNILISRIFELTTGIAGNGFYTFNLLKTRFNAPESAGGKIDFLQSGRLDKSGVKKQTRGRESCGKQIQSVHLHTISVI